MSDRTEPYVEERPKLQDEPAREAPPEHDPQADARAAIAERYEQRRLAEIQEGRERMGLPAEEEPEEEAPRTEPDGVTAQPEATPRAEPAEPTREVPVTQPSVAPQAQPQQGPQLFPLQAPDGRWHYVTAEQAAQLAQIGAGYVQQQQQQPQRPPTQAAPPPVARQGFDSERAKAIAQRLSFGTTDEQAQALQEFAEHVRPEQPAIDVEAIRRQAAQEALGQIRLENNLAIIGREYGEIFNDPVLTQVAAVQLHQLRGNPQNSYRSDLDLYREACNAVRSRLNSAVPQQPQPAVQSSSAALQAAPSQQRLERKRAAPTIPVATDRRLAMAEEGPREPTASEIIQGIRKARGQPTIS